MRALADRVRVLLAILGPLGAGSRILLLRLVGRFGWKLAGAGLLLAVYAVARYPKWFVWMLLAWCVGAWMHAPDDDVADEPAGEEPAGPDPQDVADLVRDLIGDASGVLLTTLRSALHAPDTRAVREVLAAAGIGVRPGVRAAAGNGPGVHRDDLPAPDPLPQDSSWAVVVAGEDANTNANNALRVQSREGMTIINDPADSHRAHSLKKPRTGGP